MAKILIIDDDPLYLDDLAHGLRGLAHDVTTAGSGPEGLLAFRKASFDIAICDVLMQGGGALSFLHEVRASNSNLPVIIITGNEQIASSPLFIEGMRDANAKVEKTASLAEINALVQALLVSSPS